jgi:hypothetical protein
MPVMLPVGAVPRSAPPAAALFGLDQGQAAGTPGNYAVPQPGGGIALNPGEMVLPPRPTAPPGYTPSWPAQPVPPQQPQYQPPQQYAPQPQAYSPQPQLPPQQPAPQLFYQPPAAQPAVLPVQQFTQPILQQQPAAPPPVPQPNYQQFTMPPDGTQGGAQPYQFNDGLALGGRVGGQPAPQGVGPQPALGVPPAAQAPVGGVQLPAGAQHSVAPQSTALRDSLIQQGYQVGFYANDQQLLDDIGTSQQSLGQLRQMARLGWQAQQGQPTAAPLSNGQPSQPQPTQQPLPAGIPASNTVQKPPRPEWKREWDGMVRRDPTSGRFVPADAMVNPLVAERANELAAWERNRAEELVNDGLTRGDLDAILAERMQTLQTQIRQDFEREQQEAAGQEQVRQFLASNAQHFFQIGANGQPVVNPVTGQPLTTPVGQMALAYGNQYAQQFEAAYGLAPLPQQVIEHVQLRLTADQAAGRLPMAQQPALAQPAGAGTPGGIPPAQQPSPQQLRDNLINQAVVRNQQIALAAYAPNQQGTIATAAQNATAPQNPRLSFRDQLLQAAEAKGQVPQGYVQAYR